MYDKIREAEEHYERGNQFDDAGDAARAIQEWETAVQLNPNYFDAHYNLGITYADEGDLTRAVYEMETARSLDPDDKDALRELAQMLLERGDAFMAQKDRDHAIADWERVAELDPENPLVHFKLGQAFADKLADTDAEEHLRTAIQYDPYLTDAYDKLAEIYLAQDRTREAKNVLRQALNALHSIPRRRSVVGTVMASRLGDMPSIEKLPLDTSVSDLARDLAELELDDGNPDQAMAALEQAEPEKEDAEMWREIAQAFEGRGDDQSAEIARNRAKEAEQGPADQSASMDAGTRVTLAEGHFKQGEAHYERGDTEQAFEEYVEAIRLNPDHADAHYSLGLIYQQDEEYELAEKEFREALRIDANSPQVHYALGQVFDARQDWQSALREYRDVLRSAPDDQDAREGLIWDLLETNALAEAQRELEQGELDPSAAADLWQEVGKMYEERGGRADSIAAYERALALNRDLPEARAALKGLRA